MRTLLMPLTTALALVLPLSPASASTGTGTGGSAFGIAANGPITIKPVPSVLTSTTEIVRKSLLRERGVGQLATASVMSVTASPDHATSSVADLNALRSQLRARAIAANCHHGQGGVQLTQATVAGKNLEVSPAPNTRLSIPLGTLGTVALTLNKQVVQPDGGLTVTAVAVAVPLGGGRSQSIDIASATCRGTVDAGGLTSPDAPGAEGLPYAPAAQGLEGVPAAQGASGNAQVVKEAPAPTPVKGVLPVTG
jgi:hypothetical protein